MSEDRAVTGSVYAEVTATVPLEVNATLIDPSGRYEPYIPSITGSFHMEARKGFLVLRNLDNFDVPGYMIPINKDTLLIEFTSSTSVSIHTGHQLWFISLAPDIGLTANFFVDLIEATNTGERLSTNQTKSAGVY